MFEAAYLDIHTEKGLNRLNLDTLPKFKIIFSQEKNTAINAQYHEKFRVKPLYLFTKQL